MSNQAAKSKNEINLITFIKSLRQKNTDLIDSLNFGHWWIDQILFNKDLPSKFRVNSKT